MNYKVKIGGEEIIVSSKEIENIVFHDSINRITSKDGKVYTVSSTKGEKEGQISINHNTFDFQILDQYDQVVEKLGLDVIAEQKSTDIYAPMPGLILDIMVKEGDEVQEGDSILILEAMKMENVIKAAGNGSVSGIHFKLGDKVEKGQLIIEIN